MPPQPRAQDPLEVVSQIRSAAIVLGADSGGGFYSPGGPLRAAHVRAARAELDQRGRATFVAERWATQPVAARARVVWRGWAQGFAASLTWEQGESGGITPRMKERLDELHSLLSGPATRGELRVLEAYEGYFQTLFTLGWAVVMRADPAGDMRRLDVPGGRGANEAALAAWTELQAAWIAPWWGRRRHDEVLGGLMRWIDGQSGPAALGTSSMAGAS